MVLKETCVYRALSPGEGGPSCGKSRRQLSGLSTEPGCRRLLVQACTRWGVCLRRAKWVQKNFLLCTMQTGVKMLLVLATNPNGFIILKVLWPGASLGCLEGAWAAVDPAKTWPGASAGALAVNCGPATCGEDKQQEPACANVETKRAREEKPQTCACCRNISLCYCRGPKISSCM